MGEKIKIFGVALDPLFSPERLNLKIAYLIHIGSQPQGNIRFKDPYDFVKNLVSKDIIQRDKIEWIGKVHIPSWLSPKPKMMDLHKISISRMNRFLKGDGCWNYALKIADYVNKKIYPEIPLMIGVDHSLTGGSIMSLAERYSNLNIVIMDAHFDVMNNDKICEQDFTSGNPVVSSFHDRGTKSKTPLNYYGCGNFLNRLLERRVIAPKNLWILGVQDEIYRELRRKRDLREWTDSNVISVERWIKAGVHVIFKHEVQSGNFKIDLNGPVYLSVDLDVGSLSSIHSARFMNSYGLNTAEFLQLLHKVSGFIRSNYCPLVGLDLMEFDIHFWGAIKDKKIDDRTEEVVKEIFRVFVNHKGGKDAS